jgi:hypothetical protein
MRFAFEEGDVGIDNSLSTDNKVRSLQLVVKA